MGRIRLDVKSKMQRNLHIQQIRESEASQKLKIKMDAECILSATTATAKSIDKL
jgi:hypothetical protein